MNGFNAKGRKVFGGWHGEFKPSWKAEYLTVQELDARGNFTGPKLFKSENEAECAAWRALKAMEQSPILGTGKILSKPRLELEKIFGGMKA